MCHSQSAVCEFGLVSHLEVDVGLRSELQLARWQARTEVEAARLIAPRHQGIQVLAVRDLEIQRRMAAHKLSAGPKSL